jgi:hypothetical protein
VFKSLFDSVKRSLSSILTIFKEDGDASPYSSRRIALAFVLYFAYNSLTFGLQAAFMAGSAGADWKVVALMLTPFFICILAIITIIIRLTATDIQQLIESAKGN